MDSSVPPNLFVGDQCGTNVTDLDLSVEERITILKRLSETLRTSDNERVVLIGDVMLDRYHHGYANNLNSTAPVPVLKITRTEENAGAAAHIAQSLSSLGITVDFHSAVGNDVDGRTILNNLKKLEVNISGVHVIENHLTMVKTRYFGSRESLLDRPQIMLQTDIEDPDGIPENITSRIRNGAVQGVKGSTAIVISDYDKGVITKESARNLIKEAVQHNIPVVMDPKLTGLDRSGGATIVIFERRGLDLLRRRLGKENARDAAMELVKQHGWGAIIVLGGNSGVTLYHSDGRRVFTPSSIINPRQQIGLHDAAASAISFALGNGHNLVESSILASAACDCILESKHGDSILTRESLMLRIDEISWKMQISDR